MPAMNQTVSFIRQHGRHNCRLQRTEEEKAFYYCLFNPIQKIPACEFLTTRHNATWLCAMLELFNEDAKRVNGRRSVRPNFIVTDFSFALIYAVLHAYNKMTFVEYLNFAYKVLAGRCTSIQISDRTFLNFCCAHFSKSLSTRLKRVENSARARRAAMVLFTLLMRTCNLEDAMNVYKNIYILLCSEMDSLAVQRSFDRLTRLVKKTVPDKKDIFNRLEEEEKEEVKETEDETVQVHESTASIKQQSPFTRYFQRVIDNTKLDNSGQERNSAYSPASFKVIADVIHLYPLWAAALHGNPTRFAIDADDVARTAPLPTNRSNAPIESHFRSVKVNKKRKVRPRVFIKERLKCAVARYNEASIAFPSTRKRKRTVADDPASAPEIWNRRRKTKSYADKSFGLDALHSIRKTKTKTSKTLKSAESPYSTSPPQPASPIDFSTPSEVTFKTHTGPATCTSSKESSFSLHDTVDFAPDPARSSTPIVTALVPVELDDNVVQLLQDLLKEKHPDVAGLEFTGLGYGNIVPKFAPADNRFVQIVNVGDHWICLTNIFGSDTHEVYVFDSLQRKVLSQPAISQISSILRNDDSANRIRIRIRKFGRQAARSRACGLFAAAAAFACCNGSDPTGIQYEEDDLQRHITSRLVDRDSTDIPGKRRWPPHDVADYFAYKLYCTCHR